MDKFILNSFINSTLNVKLIYNVISIEPVKKRVAKPVYSNYLKKNTYIYNNIDDYLIEYKLFTELVNGEKAPVDNFTHKSFLTEFNPTEKKFIEEMIKLRQAVIESATTITTETIIM
jgi:hypothetical protein